MIGRKDVCVIVDMMAWTFKTPVMVYLEITDLITIDQPAYMQQHNTQTALHRVIDDWLCNMSDGNLTAVCSFDIKKSFDKSFYSFKEDGISWVAK